MHSTQRVGQRGVAFIRRSSAGWQRLRRGKRYCRGRPESLRSIRRQDVATSPDPELSVKLTNHGGVGAPARRSRVGMYAAVLRDRIIELRGEK